MKREFNCFEAVFLALVVLLALFGVVQAAGPYQVVIVGDSPPHSSSVEVGPGKSIDMRMVILNVTDWPVAGSSLYLNYDPKVISSVSCVRSIFKEFNKCEEVEPGRFLFEGYDTFAKYTGDVVVEVLRITANASAPEGSSTTLRISGPRPGAVSGGTPVWGPFWQGIETSFGSGMLTVKQQETLAGIQVSKTVYPGSGSPSTNVTFNITVNNTGTADLNNVTAIDTLPEGMRYVSSSPVTGNVSGRVVTWDNIGPLLSNSSPVSLVLVAHVNQGASGNLRNSVKATGKPERGGVVTSTATANFTALEAGIQVNKTVYPRAGAPSTNVTFNITVNNTGTADLGKVAVVDTLPVGLSYVSSMPVAENISDREITWKIGQLLSNSSPVSLELVANVDRGASGELVNSVEAIGVPEHGGIVTSTATANFTALEAGIQVNKAVYPSSGAPSTNVTFNITVSNPGTADLGNVAVVDTLPEGMRYVSSSPVTGNVSGGVVTWDNIGPLLSNSSPVSLELVAQVGPDASGELVNSVEAIGMPEHGGIVTSTATADFTALEAGIQVRKIANPKVVGVLFPVAFEIQVKNTGEIALDNVTLRDTLPSGMFYLSSSPHGKINSGNVNWDLGTLEPHESRLIELIAKIGFRAGDCLRNEVIAEGSPISGADVTSSAFAVVKVDRELNMAYIAG